MYKSLIAIIKSFLSSDFIKSLIPFEKEDPLIRKFANTGMLTSVPISMYVFVPQIYLMYSIGNADGISLQTLLLSFYMQFFGLLDVIIRKSWIHVCVYGTGITGCLICSLMALYYRGYIF